MFRRKSMLFWRERKTPKKKDPRNADERLEINQSLFPTIGKMWGKLFQWKNDINKNSTNCALRKKKTINSDGLPLASVDIVSRISPMKSVLCRRWPQCLLFRWCEWAIFLRWMCWFPLKLIETVRLLIRRDFMWKQKQHSIKCTTRRKSCRRNYF